MRARERAFARGYLTSWNSGTQDSEMSYNSKDFEDLKIPTRENVEKMNALPRLNSDFENSDMDNTELRRAVEDTQQNASIMATIQEGHSYFGSRVAFESWGSRGLRFYFPVLLAVSASLSFTIATSRLTMHELVISNSDYLTV